MDCISKGFDGSVDFNKKWNEYKNGFGDKDGEHWLGNDNIHFIASFEEHEIYVQGVSFSGEI